jgi:RNA polymerase-binding transcription factor DksA
MFVDFKSDKMASKQEKEKTKYNNSELKEFEILIDNKLLKAKEQLKYYMDQIQELSENDDSKLKGLDDGISSVETERLYTMAARQKKLIQHLQNAKLRIENNVYGICRATGKLISKERLMAVPHATLSIEAKQKG